MDYGGTSSALPHVVGCAALIKQVSPDISSDKLAETLYKYAQADEFTGAVPNDIWGYGKIRIYESMTLSQLITPVQPYIQEYDLPAGFTVSHSYPNPFNGAVSFDVSVPHQSDNVLVNVYNVLGQKIIADYFHPDGNNTLHFMWAGKDKQDSSLPSGIYLFQFVHSTTSITRRALLLR